MMETYTNVEVISTVGIDIDPDHLRAETSGHASVHFVAGAGQIPGEIEMAFVQSLHIAEGERSG